MLRIERVFPWQKEGSFTRTDPYTIAFVYTKKDSFILKGGLNSINGYMKIYVKDKKVIALVHKILWHHGTHRGYIQIYGNDNISISRYQFTGDSIILSGGEPSHDGKKRLYLKTEKTTGQHNYKELCSFRRIPRSWIKQLDVIPYVKG